MDSNSNPKLGQLDKHQLARLGIFIGLTVIIILIDLVYADKFMDMSIELSKWLQQYNMDIPSFLLSYIVVIFGFVFVVAHFFKVKDKSEDFSGLFGLMICVWVHAFAKMMYMDTRPSFKSTELKNGTFNCVAEFGKPSGHALFSFFLFLRIARILEKRFFMGEKIKIAIGFVINCLIATSIGITRFYFGVHSFNQVILGALLGSTIYFLVILLHDHIDYYIYKPIFVKSQPDDHRTLKILLVTFGSLFSLSILSYLRARFTLEADDSFKDSIVNCTYVKDGDFIFTFTDKMEYNCIFFACFNFLMIGYLFNPHNVKLGLFFYYDKSKLLFMCRLLLLVLTLSPVSLAVLFKFKFRLVNIICQTLIFGVVSFFSGRELFNIMDLIGLPYCKEEETSKAEKENIIEMS